MVINWNSGQRFNFGNLDAAQQSLYEDQPNLGFQKLMEWYGQGDPNFANTTLGRYIASQQDRLSNDYLGKAAQQQADWAGRASSWDTQQQANLDAYNKELAGWNQQYDAAKANQNSGTAATMAIAMMNINRLTNNPYQKRAWQNPDAGNQLTWTKYLEQNPAASGEFTRQFGYLPANQRGAQPGAFEVRRNLW